MAIIVRSENEQNIEIAECIDESLLDLSGVPDPTRRKDNQSIGLPIISVKENIERNATWEIIEGKNVLNLFYRLPLANIACSCLFIYFIFIILAE